MLPMRLDLYLSTLGIIKRRTVAKEMGDSGLIKLNGHRSKPANEVKVGDVIQIGGGHPVTVEVTMLPERNVRKEDRGDYYRQIG